MNRRVAVVGAGCSGLAAAVALVDAGCAVSVFDASRQGGGRARTVDFDGLALDNGQHLLSGAYGETLALLARIGVDADAALLRLPLNILVPGHFHLRLPRLPAPLHLALGMLVARGPRLAEKLAAARFIRRLQRARYRLPADRTVDDWLDANGQQGALRRHLWQALCLAALNTPPERASAQVFANVLRDTLGGPRSATDLLLPRVDLGRLLAEPALAFLAARGAGIRLGQRVRRVASGRDGIEVSGHGFVDRFDDVVLACAPQHLAALLPTRAELDALRRTVDAFTWEPIATVYVRYPPRVRLPLPLLALAGEPAQWLFDRGQLDGPPGLLAHVLSASGTWDALDNAALGAALHMALADVMPGLPAPLAQHVVRERRATFACTPGLARPAHATAVPGLWLAGDYTASDYPATIEGAVRSGNAAARALLQAAAS